MEVIAWLAAQPWCTGGVGHDGQLLGRVQCAPGRGPAAPGAPGDHHLVLDRRPLRGRHPLHGRVPPHRTTCAGRRPCSPTTRGPRTRRSSATAGGRCGSSASRGSGLWIDTWLRHQRRDAFWKQGSVCEDFAAIQCPVLAVGGWTDGYSNAIPRLMQGLGGPAPRRSSASGRIAIPTWRCPGRRWASSSSRSAGGTPGSRRRRRRAWRAPAPGLHAGERPPRGHVRDPARPVDRGACLAVAAHHRHGGTSSTGPASRQRPGPRCRSRSARRRRSGSTRAAGAPTASRPICPSTSGSRTAGRSPSTPIRSPSGSRSWARRWPTSSSAVDRPVALVAARLSDVAPDGAATRVSYGLLNLTHRESHEHPDGRSSRGGATGCASSSTTSRRRSRRATASASRCRPPTGRPPGRRPSR